MKYVLTLLAFLAIPAAAAPTSSEINLDIGTPPVMVAKHSWLSAHRALFAFMKPGSSAWATTG